MPLPTFLPGDGNRFNIQNFVVFRMIDNVKKALTILCWAHRHKHPYSSTSELEISLCSVMFGTLILRDCILFCALQTSSLHVTVYRMQKELAYRTPCYDAIVPIIVLKYIFTILKGKLKYFAPITHYCLSHITIFFSFCQ